MRTALRSHTPDEPYATPPAATYAAPRGAYGAARATAGVAAEVLATRHGQPRVSLLVQPGRRHSCPQWWRTGDRGGDQTQLRHHVVLAGSDQAEIAVPPSAPLPHSRKRRGLRGSCRRSRSFCFGHPRDCSPRYPREEDCRSRLEGRRRSRKSPRAGRSSTRGASRRERALVSKIRKAQQAAPHRNRKSAPRLADARLDRGAARSPMLSRCGRSCWFLG